MKRIADLKKMERCEKMLWLSKKEPQPFQPFIYYNEDIYELVKQKLQLKDCYMGKKGDDNAVFFDHEQEFTAFSRLRFTYQDLRVQVPFLIRYKTGYRVYFVYASCYPKESEAQRMADILWVLKHLQIKILKVNTVHLNAQYVRDKKIDVGALLIINDYLYNDKNHVGEAIKKLIKAKERNVVPLLEKVDEILSKTRIDARRSTICTKKNKCIYFEKCFPDPVQDTSILNLVSSAYKFSLYEKGCNDLSQVEFDEIEGTRHQYAQVVAAKTNALFFDTCAVKQFFESKITYPISYLDFEWETYAFPAYVGMKPFDTLAFQYSLHIEYENEKKLIHCEYLGKQDCRIEFIEHLLRDLPLTGSIMCFNVEGAEKLRLRNLAKQFPQYNDALQSIWERMVDLSIPFSNGMIYDNRMAGMYSLKKLVSIFTNYDYSDLDISHGLEAVRNYRMMAEEDNEHQMLIRKELLTYCAMDTYAEYLIYHWILAKLGKKTNRNTSRT